MTFRVVYNYVLAILGIRQMLPGEVLRSKPIRECNEPMVRLTPSVGLFVDDNAKFCRRSVAEKLRRVAEQLSKEEMGLYIYELYRTPEQQKTRFEETRRYLQSESVTGNELEMLVRRCTAGVGGGHQTGGAVDLTLCDKDGMPLDMGSMYPVKCPEMVTSYRLPVELKNRRKLLCRVMRKEGFANYPGEWWHFSYGDQLWAAYRCKRFAIYGLASLLPPC